MSRHVRLAVLTSRHTRSHLLGALATLRDHVTVSWLLGNDVTAVQQLADQHSFVTSRVGKARDWDNVCKDNSVEALVVCSPDASVNMVRRALRSGKSVLCERPVFLQPSALVACYEEAQAHNAHLLFGFPRGFDPGLVELKTHLAAGLVGKVHRVDAVVSHRPLAPSPHSVIPDPDAVFREAVSREVDTVCWLLGASPRSVSATRLGAGTVGPGTPGPDHPVLSTNLVLSFPEATATIGVTGSSQGQQADDRLEIHGSKGVLQLTSKSSDGSSVVAVRLGGAAWRMMQDTRLGARHQAASAGLLKRLVSAVRGEADMTEDDACSLNTICVTAACQRALCSNQTVTMATTDTELPEVNLKRPMWKERPAAWF